MSAKSPYNRHLAYQLAEIPLQLAHHLRRSQPMSRPEKHHFGPSWRQYLLFWMPPADIPLKNSVVMFYHGGGWRVGSPGMHPTLTEFFLRQGFPVVMPAYRLAPWAWHQQMREDIGLALQTTLRLMHEKNLGTKKVLIGGMSAGSTLAAHLAFDRPALQQLGLTQAIFSGFLSFAGPLDLSQMPAFRAVRNYAGGRPGTAAFDNANPMRYLQPDEHLPLLLTHGTTDAIVPFACSESFFQHYSGPKVLYPLAGKTHLDSLRFATDDLGTSHLLQKWLADK